MWLGIDVGTTHCKVGLFDPDGCPRRLASRDTPVSQGPDSYPFHDPEELWGAVAGAIRDVMAGAEARVEAVGVASMAEAGLLVNRQTGSPHSQVIPWYDTRAVCQVEAVMQAEQPAELFRRSGLHPSFKYGLPKLLWLRQHQPEALTGAMWLSVADYIVFRLTGRLATDPTLAVRTYLYRLTEARWDEPWIRSFGLDPAMFPPVLPSGATAGSVDADGARVSGLAAGTPVGVAGHDHLCALLAVGIVAPGPVLDSIGTAESMIGVMETSAWDDGWFDTGLSVAPHLLGEMLCWLGGLPSAGGSIEWFRHLLGDGASSYADIVDTLDEMDQEPTGILYFPFLSGSGAPWHDQEVRAAFIGLAAADGRGRIVKAILEGTAYAAESIHRAAEQMTVRPIGEMIAVGGGAKNLPWMHIRANVTGCTYHLPALEEATTLGAALAVALGRHSLDLGDIAGIAARGRRAGRSIFPVDRTRAQYRDLYETGYLPFQTPLRGAHRA